MTQKEVKQKVSELTAEWNSMLIKLTEQQLSDVQFSTFLSTSAMYFKNRFDSLILIAASNAYKHVLKDFKPNDTEQPTGKPKLNVEPKGE